MTLFELERNADFEQLLTYLEESPTDDIRQRAAEIIGSLESKTSDGEDYGYPRGDIIDVLVEVSQEDEADGSVRPPSTRSISSVRTLSSSLSARYPDRISTTSPNGRKRSCLLAASMLTVPNCGWRQRPVSGESAKTTF